MPKKIRHIYFIQRVKVVLNENGPLTIVEIYDKLLHQVSPRSGRMYKNNPTLYELCNIVAKHRDFYAIGKCRPCTTHGHRGRPTEMWDIVSEGNTNEKATVIS